MRTRLFSVAAVACTFAVLFGGCTWSGQFGW